MSCPPTLDREWPLDPPQEPSPRMSHPDQKRGARAGPPLPVTRAPKPGHSLAAANPPAFLAGESPGPSDGFCRFTDLPLGGLFVMLAKLHLAEDAFALHLPL